MKRFRFRLESVRTIRDLAERRARERFGLAQQKVAEAEEALRLAAFRRSELADALAGARTGCFRPGEQIGGMAALRLAEQAETQARRLLLEAGAARDRSREEWLVARRQLKIIERLEERARLVHREASEKAEQNILDELACLAAARTAPLA
ncbi:MAG: flagellar FliJ family protein [Opitutaceae bacterium]|jgi:flagellar FliJ protein